MYRWVVVIVISLGFTACDGKRRNQAVCCTTPADCEALGSSEQLLCETGLICADNSCIKPAACQADSDCDAAAPHCTPEKVCGQCLEDADCSDSVCDSASHTCVECVDTGDCGNRVCNTATNLCGPCSAGAECATGFCESSKVCRGTEIVPRHVPTACDGDGPAADLVITVNTDLTTDVDCNLPIVTQVGGPEICGIRYRRITIEAGVVVTVQGVRALALVATEDLQVKGTLKVSAGSGTAPSGGSPANNVGGGGAGFVSAGGSGGTVTVAGGATNGGAPQSGIDTLLIGGNRTEGITASAYGTGGGAATLVSCRGTVDIQGVINAPGGGGAGGALRVQTNVLYGGTGGGSGGMFVLQGMNVRVVGGSAFANGGGGGAGRPNGGGTAEIGSEGLASLTPAPGGSASISFGGAGGTGDSAPGSGGRADPNNSFNITTPGGGGGSVGVLRTFTPEGTNAVLAPAAASPPFSPNGTVPTR